MAGSAYFPQLAGDTAPQPRLFMRHSAVVRLTHWINTLSFLGLLVSGIAILLAHPRLYWGETGNVDTPSLIDLPLPFVLVGQSGWGRSLHFLSAWLCVLNGSLYVLSGFLMKHFRWTAQLEEESSPYNVPQRLTYFVVVAILFPLMIWTGLAMSPAITSVFPSVVTSLGGQQSARTIHFFAAGSLVLFFFVHITMVSLAGFRNHVKAMITGKDHA
jgi:thiosulfate reductase cytochrome b subunit